MSSAHRLSDSERDRQRKLLGMRRRDLVKLVLLGFAEGTTVVAFVLVVRATVDRLQGLNLLPRDVVPLVGILAGVSVALALTRGLEFTLSEKAGYEVVRRVRMDLYRHLVGMSPRAVQRSSQGALILRFTGDLSTLRTWISRGQARGIVSSITLAAGVGVLFYLNTLIGLSVTGLLFLGAAISAAWGHQVRRANRAVRWRRSLLASNVAEQINALAVIQVFGRTAGEYNRLSTQNEDLTRALNRMAVTRGRLRVVSSLAGSLAVCAVLLVGAYAVPQGQITVADIIAAMTTARFLSGPIRILGRVNEYWQAAQVSKRKLMDFFNRPSRDAAAPELQRLRARAGSIELRDVCVKDALQDINLIVEPGQILAITGANGAGKSTLLSLLARLAEPDSGQVIVDGQVLADCSPQSTYRHVGIVSPDLPLMRGTVRRNLSYRYRDADDDELERVILNCRIDEVLDELQGGLSAWLTEGGANVSVGHRQRIALGRATLGSPRVLLLDEPTTNLDPASKEIFRRGLARYRGTVLLVTHDPAEAALADDVCVMADGRIEEYMSAAQYRAEMQALDRLDAGRPRWWVKVAEQLPLTVAPERLAPSRRKRRRTPTRVRVLSLLLGVGGLLCLAAVVMSTVAKPVPNPAAGAPKISLLGKGERFTVVWLGDTLLGDAAEPQLDVFGPAWAAAKIPPPQADVVIANAEAPITDRVQPFDLLQEFSYQQQPRMATAIADLGIDVVALANNHAMDRGPLGLADTLANAQAAGLLTFGAGATTAQARLPLLVETDIGVLAVVGFSDDGGVKISRTDRPGIRRLNQANIDEDLELARRAGADWVVGYVQWGENYSQIDERQRAFAQALATVGYDLVIGLHPHVVQPVEIVSGVPVIYSLGNYVFTTPGRFNDAVPGFGLMVTSEFSPGKLALTMRCIQTDNELVLFQPRPCDATQAQLVLGALHPQVRIEGDVARLELPLRTARKKN